MWGSLRLRGLGAAECCRCAHACHPATSAPRNPPRGMLRWHPRIRIGRGLKDSCNKFNRLAILYIIEILNRSLYIIIKITFYLIKILPLV